MYVDPNEREGAPNPNISGPKCVASVCGVSPDDWELAQRRENKEKRDIRRVWVVWGIMLRKAEK